MSCLCFMHAWEMKSKIFQCPSPTTYAKPDWFACKHQGGNTPKTVLLLVWSPCDEHTVHILGLTYSTNCSWLTSNMPLKGNKSLQHNFPFKHIISLLRKKNHKFKEVRLIVYLVCSWEARKYEVADHCSASL